MREPTALPVLFQTGQRVKPLGLTHVRRHGMADAGIFIWPGHAATVYACDARRVTLILDGLPHHRWVCDPAKLTAA